MSLNSNLCNELALTRSNFNDTCIIPFNDELVFWPDQKGLVAAVK